MELKDLETVIFEQGVYGATPFVFSRVSDGEGTVKHVLYFVNVYEPIEAALAFRCDIAQPNGFESQHLLYGWMDVQTFDILRYFGSSHSTELLMSTINLYQAEHFLSDVD